MGWEPPFTGVAVKVTEPPVQILVADAATPTAGTRLAGPTAMVILLLVAVAGTAHDAELVMMTFT